MDTLALSSVRSLSSGISLPTSGLVPGPYWEPSPLPSPVSSKGSLADGTVAGGPVLGSHESGWQPGNIWEPEDTENKMDPFTNPLDTDWRMDPRPQGKPWNEGTTPGACPICAGEGKVFGKDGTSLSCSNCAGSGYSILDNEIGSMVGKPQGSENGFGLADTTGLGIDTPRPDQQHYRFPQDWYQDSPVPLGKPRFGSTDPSLGWGAWTAGNEGRGLLSQDGSVHHWNCEWDEPMTGFPNHVQWLNATGVRDGVRFFISPIGQLSEMRQATPEQKQQIYDSHPEFHPNPRPRWTASNDEDWEEEDYPPCEHCGAGDMQQHDVLCPIRQQNQAEYEKNNPSPTMPMPSLGVVESCPQCGGGMKEWRNNMGRWSECKDCGNRIDSTTPTQVPADWTDPLKDQFSQPSGLQWNDPRNSKVAGDPSLFSPGDEPDGGWDIWGGEPIWKMTDQRCRNCGEGPVGLRVVNSGPDEWTQANCKNCLSSWTHDPWKTSRRGATPSPLRKQQAEDSSQYGSDSRAEDSADTADHRPASHHRDRAVASLSDSHWASLVKRACEIAEDDGIDVAGDFLFDRSGDSDLSADFMRQFARVFEDSAGV
jgi:uncharacterized protein (DUF983 family)